MNILWCEIMNKHARASYTMSTLSDHISDPRYTYTHRCHGEIVSLFNIIIILYMGHISGRQNA